MARATMVVQPHREARGAAWNRGLVGTMYISVRLPTNLTNCFLPPSCVPAFQSMPSA